MICASPATIVTLLEVSLDFTPNTSLRTTLLLRAMIFAKSKDTSETFTAYFDAWRAPSYVFAEYNNVLVGIHPSFRQTPPRLFFSISNTLKPALPAASAAVYPAGPPPIIIS